MSVQGTLIATEVHGADLEVGMTVKVGGRWRAISYIRWGEAPWMLHPGHPLKVPAAYVEACENPSLCWTAYPSDHYERRAT